MPYSNGRRLFQLNPVIAAIRENWQQYGFDGRSEAVEYVGWVMARSLITGADLGCRNSRQVLEQYPLETFRDTLAIKPVPYA